MENNQVPAPQPEVEKVVNYVDDLYRTSKTANVSLKNVLSVVTDAEEFLRYFRDRVAVEAAVKHVPETIEALAAKAKQGNVDAAKVLLEITGSLGKGSKQQVNIANQINLSVDELNELKREVLGNQTEATETVDV